MKTPSKCGNCGSEELISSTDAHFSLPWKDYPSVLLTESVDAWSCADCNELIFSADQGSAIDTAITHSITLHINHFISTISERENCEQRSIASHIGVSPEYLSEIKSGRKIPKFQTFNFLKTLAFDKESFRVSSPTFKDWKTA